MTRRRNANTTDNSINQNFGTVYNVTNTGFKCWGAWGSATKDSSYPQWYTQGY
jgi:hypothetical protein